MYPIIMSTKTRTDEKKSPSVSPLGIEPETSCCSTRLHSTTRLHPWCNFHLYVLLYSMGTINPNCGRMLRFVKGYQKDKRLHWIPETWQQRKSRLSMWKRLLKKSNGCLNRTLQFLWYLHKPPGRSNGYFGWFEVVHWTMDGRKLKLNLTP
ncbi:hypothetical protein FXO38_17770 [Capsicum annuum]|nr:hypothetical protein FXO37_29905 [Capsicum annuum]KAF3649235.1 hypothetical protein FXO38_17770 [Capsicum annuum]